MCFVLLALFVLVYLCRYSFCLFMLSVSLDILFVLLVSPHFCLSVSFVSFFCLFVFLFVCDCFILLVVPKRLVTTLIHILFEPDRWRIGSFVFMYSFQNLCAILSVCYLINRAQEK